MRFFEANGLRYKAFLILLYGLLHITSAFAQPNPQELLRQADRARGGGLVGMTWKVEATTFDSNSAGTDNSMSLLVKANEEASLSETLAPAKSKGTKMLQISRNMWLSKPGLKKPIPISPRLRLTGMAATGDIAATNYSRDYTAKIVREENIGKEKCYVLELVANSQQTTYDRLKYWISVTKGLGMQAEFYSLSGKLIKKAEFQYDHLVNIDGKNSPFISKMTIFDAITDAKTILEFSQIKVRALHSAELDVNNL
jgi:hypothetical protein